MPRNRPQTSTVSGGACPRARIHITEAPAAIPPWRCRRERRCAAIGWSAWSGGDFWLVAMVLPARRSLFSYWRGCVVGVNLSCAGGDPRGRARHQGFVFLHSTRSGQALPLAALPQGLQLGEG